MVLLIVVRRERQEILGFFRPGVSPPPGPSSVVSSWPRSRGTVGGPEERPLVTGRHDVGDGARRPPVGKTRHGQAGKRVQDEGNEVCFVVCRPSITSPDNRVTPFYGRTPEVTGDPEIRSPLTLVGTTSTLSLFSLSEHWKGQSLFGLLMGINFDELNIYIEVYIYIGSVPFTSEVFVPTY